MIKARLHLQFADFKLETDLQWPGRGVTALFGYSGSGKTTLLHCIAGLEGSNAQGWLLVWLGLPLKAASLLKLELGQIVYIEIKHAVVLG